MHSPEFSASILVDWRCAQSSVESGRRIDSLLAEHRLSPDRVAVAAALMHPGARASSVAAMRLWGDYRDRLVLALSTLDRRDNVEFAVTCAARSLDAWRAFRPNDPRVTAAFEGARATLSHDAFVGDLGSLAAAAEAAAQEVDVSLQGSEAELITACAMDAAHAASNAAAAANQSRAEFPVWASYAANHALHCAEDYQFEVAWQVSALVDLLLRPR